MSDFFDTYFNIKNIVEGKREYKEQMARLKALPEDYQYVFKRMQEYMWMFAGGDGMDMMQVQYDLIDLFEEGVANDKKVLEVTGEDVAAFCDELLKNAKTYTEDWRTKLNNDIAKKLAKK